jgi:hypothetical protein
MKLLTKLVSMSVGSWYCYFCLYRSTAEEGGHAATYAQCRIIFAVAHREVQA